MGWKCKDHNLGTIPGENQSTLNSVSISIEDYRGVKLDMKCYHGLILSNLVRQRTSLGKSQGLITVLFPDYEMDRTGKS